MLNFKELLGRVSHTLLKNQGKILSAIDDGELSNELFLLAATLLEKRQAIPFYSLTSFVLRLPSFSNVLEGSRCLNQIANCLRPLDPVSSTNNQVEVFNSLKKISSELCIVVSYEN